MNQDGSIKIGDFGIAKVKNFLPECYNIHTIVRKQLSVHLITCPQKYVRKSHTIKNLIFGPWDVFCMKWLLFAMHSMQIQ